MKIHVERDTSSPSKETMCPRHRALVWIAQFSHALSFTGVDEAASIYINKIVETEDEKDAHLLRACHVCKSLHLAQQRRKAS